MVAGTAMADEGPRILLNAGAVDTGREAVRQLRQVTDADFVGKRLYLVQFEGPIQPAWHQALTKTGVQVAIVIGAVLALIIGLRLWWTMRKLKRQGIIIDPAREREHSGAGGAGAIDGEYQVVEREGAPRLPSSFTTWDTSSAEATLNLPLLIFLPPLPCNTMGWILLPPPLRI